MALFLCLDAVRYREYLPLLIVGKIISVFALVCWSLFSQQMTMIGVTFNSMTLAGCDLLALVALVLIKNDTKEIIKNRENTEEQNMNIQNTEED